MKWLISDFVDIDVTTKEYADAMTMSGSKVETFETEGHKIDKIVVGKILSIENHPHADRLVVCQVNIGKEEPIQIVTAATNLKENDIVPVATNGATLNDGTKIKKGKLRNILSQGMFCSLKELGLTVNDFPYAIEDGIFVLQEKARLGQDIKEVIGLDDTIVKFEITPNRPDCFSMIGLARETAVTFNKDLNISTPYVKAGHGDAKKLISVKTKANDICPFYSARIIRNIKIEPSPRWMRDRLRVMGLRPINNIVDITNYVMLEYGQPMHAFDLRSVEGKQITARMAKKGEMITVLDGSAIKLDSHDLVIADAKKPIALAGIIGGKFAGIQNDTKTVVLESAHFKANTIRLSAKNHGIRTDSSLRFEKGLDIKNCLPALNRACELIEKLNAGEVMDAILLDDKSDIHANKIPFDPIWINNFLGTKINKDFMIDRLLKLGFLFDDDKIIAPSFRPDIENKADIAEEIARFYGYNKIKSTQIKNDCCGGYTKKQKFYKKITDIMIGLGLSEIATYSFVSPKSYDKVLLPAKEQLRKAVTIENPLGENTSIMRSIVLPSMIETLAVNFNQKNNDVELFEIAREYIKINDAELPLEKDKLIIGMYGNKTDFFDIKGILEEFLERINLNDYEIESATKFGYHPGRCAIVKVKGEEFGVLGEIHPQVTENYKIDSQVYAMELDINTIFNKSTQEKKYLAITKYPSVMRDLCLICDEQILAISIYKIIKKAAGSFLETLKLFDVYTGEQIEKNKKSMTYSISLRSLDRTLTDNEADQVINKIIKKLKEAGISLRS